MSDDRKIKIKIKLYYGLFITLGTSRVCTRRHKYYLILYLLAMSDDRQWRLVNWYYSTNQRHKPSSLSKYGINKEVKSQEKQRSAPGTYPLRYIHTYIKHRSKNNFVWNLTWGTRVLSLNRIHVEHVHVLHAVVDAVVAVGVGAHHPGNTPNSTLTELWEELGVEVHSTSSLSSN